MMVGIRSCLKTVLTKRDIIIHRENFLRSDITSSQTSGDDEKTFEAQPYPMDKVNISEEAKAILAREKISLPLNAYSLPSWMKDYIEPFIITDSIDHSFWNNISNMSKEKIKKYIDNDPNHEKHSSLTTLSQDKVDYHKALHNHFKNTLAENGIVSSQDYYEKVILDDNSSEKLHQSMLLKIKNDPHILKLMQTFGITSAVDTIG
ncbi:MAG: hypothetical protein AB7U24_05595 [Sulfurimonadaceae bacterium]